MVFLNVCMHSANPVNADSADLNFWTLHSWIHCHYPIEVTIISSQRMGKHAGRWIQDMSASPMYVKCSWLPVCWTVTTFLGLNQHQILPTRQYFSQLYDCLSMSCHSWLLVRLTTTAFFEFLFYQILATRQCFSQGPSLVRCQDVPHVIYVNEWLKRMGMVIYQIDPTIASPEPSGTTTEQIKPQPKLITSARVLKPPDQGMWLYGTQLLREEECGICMYLRCLW